MTFNAPAADVPLLDLPHPHLLFLGDTTEPAFAKTAFGLRDWARERCIGEFACAGATVTLTEDAYVTFSLQPDGSIATMTMKAISPLADFSFDFHDLLFRPVRGPR